MQWLNTIVDEVIARYPDGEILIESGGSPSGTYHLGHMRELVTCDAILLELRRRGRQARHIYFVDDLDNLRKIPINVPAEFEKYLGVPICDVPAPDGSDQSYADFFLQTLVDACEALGIEVEFVRSYQKYREGFFVPAIERCLDHIPEIRHALETVSGRTLDDNWSPIQVVEDGRLKKRTFVGIDTKQQLVTYKDADDNPQTTSYGNGQVKLDWRLDWPGRWWLLGVQVEPSGRDHMTKGGSYDTGVQIMRDIYGAEPPFPVSYDFINMVGDTKKMSASKGTGLDAVDGAKIMPPEVVRYWIMRAPPLKRLYFDPVNSVMQVMDEFAAFAAKPDKNKDEQQLWDIVTHSVRGRRVVSRIPFSHLVASYQAALKDTDKTLDIIKRTEHADIADEEAEIIRDELQFIETWLQKRAPDEVKFELVDKIDAVNFSDAQKVFFKGLANKVAEAPDDADGAWFHAAVYSFKDSAGLAPKELFTSLYQLLIAKDSGPRAGWFLSMLPRDWLINRLNLHDSIVGPEGIDVASADSSASVQESLSAELTAQTRFVIDQTILEKFPEAAVGYLVATIPSALVTHGHDTLADAIQSLHSRGVTSENLTAQPEIAVWRKAFQVFGVKPSKYLSSVEALTKRALKSSPAHVSPVVDEYNAISIKYLVPMGAFDLDKLKGDITLRFGHVGEMADLMGVEKPIPVADGHAVYVDEERVITWLWCHRDATATAVSESTTHAVFFVDSLLGRELAEKALNELAYSLQKLGVEIVNQGLVATE